MHISQNQVILLMITDSEKWHYLAAKNCLHYLREYHLIIKEILSCIYCLHSFRTKNKLKKYKNVCENYDCCHIEMPKESKKIIKCNHGKKSMKASFVIYANLECLLKKK